MWGVRFRRYSSTDVIVPVPDWFRTDAEAIAYAAGWLTSKGDKDFDICSGHTIGAAPSARAEVMGTKEASDE